MSGGADLAGWTAPEIDNECRAAYNRYKRARNEHYTRYFKDHPELTGAHPLKAKDLESALPGGHAGLSSLIPAAERHSKHLSGNSSQVLALGLLAPAAAADPSLNWLLAALDPAPPPPRPGSTAQVKFEMTLDPELLGEQPRQTAIDFFAKSDEFVLCLEAKWIEEGMGRCNCPDPRIAVCSERILRRELYWQAAHDVFGLDEREPGKPCPINSGYQAIRNAAAAIALAGRRDAILALVYDGRNPYFAGSGDWPGWPAVLRETVADHAGGKAHFASVSWQDLVRHLELDGGLRHWAGDKHQLPV